MEVLSEIRSAEEAALEARRVAASAAKDSIKLAEQENEAYKEQMIAEAKVRAARAIAEAQQASKQKLDAQQAERLKGCDALKRNAEARLDRAARVCIERIIG